MSVTVEAKDLRFPVVVFDEDNGDYAQVCNNQKELSHELNDWSYEYCGTPVIAEVRRDLITETVVKKVVKTEKHTKIVKKARS